MKNLVFLLTMVCATISTAQVNTFKVVASYEAKLDEVGIPQQTKAAPPTFTHVSFNEDTGEIRLGLELRVDSSNKVSKVFVYYIKNFTTKASLIEGLAQNSILTKRGMVLFIYDNPKEFDRFQIVKFGIFIPNKRTIHIHEVTFIPEGTEGDSIVFKPLK